jgi:hypothetical protein
MIGMNRAFWATMQARVTHPYLLPISNVDQSDRWEGELYESEYLARCTFKSVRRAIGPCRVFVVGVVRVCRGIWGR